VISTGTILPSTMYLLIKAAVSDPESLYVIGLRIICGIPLLLANPQLINEQIRISQPF
jgi:hypothetical protein